MMLFLAVIFIGLTIGAYQLGAKNINLKETGGIVSNSKSKTSNNINFSSWGDEERLKYFRGQITAPSDYFATSDNMVTYYGSQGGMAPPRIILTKNYQTLPKNLSDYSYMDFGDNECILIWSTDGFSSINNWVSDIGRADGSLVNKGTIAVGDRNAVLYQTSKGGKDKYVAYLPIGNKDGTSYFFETCNLNNKIDFENVIKSIKFRPDLSN